MSGPIALIAAAGLTLVLGATSVSAKSGGPVIPTPQSVCRAKCNGIYVNCLKTQPKYYCAYNNNQCLATCGG